MDTKLTMERMRLMLGLITLFVMGAVVTELFLLQHIEEWRQILPIAVIGIGVLLLLVQLVRPSAAGIVTLRVLMVLMIGTGLLGVYFHYAGNLEFQMEMDATQHGWELMKKVLEAKTPPALAPGALAQIGLLGLLYTYRHPSLK
jgi:hypothetical protein